MNLNILSLLYYILIRILNLKSINRVPYSNSRVHQHIKEVGRDYIPCGKGVQFILFQFIVSLSTFHWNPFICRWLVNLNSHVGVAYNGFKGLNDTFEEDCENYKYLGNSLPKWAGSVSKQN